MGSFPTPHSELDAAARLLAGHGLSLSGAAPESEGAEYAAHTALLDGLPVLFRTAKITPRKLGHFVTVWKRSAAGPIRPITAEDGVGAVVVSVRDAEGFVVFVFPAAALVTAGVFAGPGGSGGSGGKRAFRVYAPWVTPDNAQALRAQRWQAPHALA